MKDLSYYLKNTYIKNDRGDLRKLYFYLCESCGLHKEFLPEDYQWTWIFEDNLGILQHAPERRYVRNKKEVTIDYLNNLKHFINT